MSLSTLGLDGFPKTRIVLLKRFTWEGFVFFSNYQSEKGRAMEKDSRVSLNFFWHSLERQIVIKGRAEKLGENLSDGYFETRPDGSKLGAWASDQSQEVESREALDRKLADMEKRFEGQEIPRTSSLGWLSGASRIH